MLMLCCAPWMAASIAGKICSPFWKSATALPSLIPGPNRVPTSRRNCALSTALTWPSRCRNRFSCGHTLSSTMPISSAPSAPATSHGKRRRRIVAIATAFDVPAISVARPMPWKRDAGSAGAPDRSAGTHQLVRERACRRHRLVFVGEMFARHGAQAAVGQPHGDAEAAVLLLVQQRRERFSLVLECALMMGVAHDVDLSA